MVVKSDSENWGMVMRALFGDVVYVVVHDVRGVYMVCVKVGASI